MKLKDKKTGQPMTFKLVTTNCECLTEHEVDTLYGEPITLETLNKYCEDYEEPKEYWYIDSDGEILYEPTDGYKFDMDCKRIGNYFKTKEEAEKAVEKLKAWKRLKDAGFRFYKKWDSKSPEGPFYYVNIYAKIDPVPDRPDFMKDLDLLFGGEE